MNRKKPPKQEYSEFREYVEVLSEKARILRNHFYNHAFSDGTLLKAVEVRDVIDELIRIAEDEDPCRTGPNPHRRRKQMVNFDLEGQS